MGKTKKKTHARVAGRRKQIKECAAEQLCLDDISMDLSDRVQRFVDIGLIRRVSVNIPVIAVNFPNFYRTFLFSYLEIFAYLIR